MGEDETENINHAIALSQKCFKNVEDCKLYVFTTRDECEYLINQRDKKEPAKEEEGKRPEVRRINEISSLIYHYLDEQGYDKLYTTARVLPPSTKGDKTWKVINAVIIGVGLHGTEMIKALSWFCQMEGYRLRIDAFDKDPLAQKRFTASCSELMNNQNTRLSCEDAICEIKFHVGIDVTTDEFFEAIKSLNKPSEPDKTTYALIALGSDIMNIRTAIKVRTCFAQAGVTTREQVKELEEGKSRPAEPIIQAIVYKAYECQTSESGAELHRRDNSVYKENESQNDTKLINYKKENYSIEFIGGIASTYQEKVIINSELEERAKKIHTLYYDEETFIEYEYFYRSSCAAAIHIKAIARELSEHKFTYASEKPNELITESVDPNLLLQVDLFLKVINLFTFEPNSTGCKCSILQWKEKKDYCPGLELFNWANDNHSHHSQTGCFFLGKMEQR